MEMLCDTVPKNCAGVTPSSPKRNIRIGSVDVPKSRGIHSIFSSAAGGRVSADRLRRVVGRTVITSLGHQHPRWVSYSVDCAAAVSTLIEFMRANVRQQALIGDVPPGVSFTWANAEAERDN